MARYRVEVRPRSIRSCAGVEEFEVDDELYLCPVFESEVDPFLETDADVSAAAMIDTYREVRFGERVAAQDQHGSRFLGWSKTHGRSRIVYLLPGHGAGTMGNEQYRRLLVERLPVGQALTSLAATVWTAAAELVARLRAQRPVGEAHRVHRDQQVDERARGQRLDRSASRRRAVPAARAGSSRTPVARGPPRTPDAAS